MHREHSVIKGKGLNFQSLLTDIGIKGRLQLAEKLSTVTSRLAAGKAEGLVLFGEGLMHLSLFPSQGHETAGRGPVAEGHP